MIPDTKILKLVRAVNLGRIRGQVSHRVLGISQATFWRWVDEAEKRGVQFHKNPRGRRIGHEGAPAPWRVKTFGPYKGA